mgnify:CR=1 FL=1|tara:strand:+ start:694 stop:939 length:246 start_codon:yes stop_codon:yes gene_type:complete
MTLDKISKINSEALLADGFEDAIIGMCMQFGQSPVVAYDYGKCLDVLKERDGMSSEESIEHMEYNVIGAYMGVYSPVFIMK